MAAFAAKKENGMRLKNWALLLFCTLSCHLFALGDFTPFLSHSSQSNLKLVEQSSKEVFEKNLSLLKTFQEQFQKFHLPAEEGKIPEIMHFICLGKNLDLQKMKNWVEQNPEFTFILWSDEEIRIGQRAEIQLKRIEELYPLKLAAQFEEAKSAAEKIDILKYQILDQFGGVFVDLNTSCLKPIKPLVRKCDFFAAMAEVSPMAKQSYVHVSNSLLGACKGHPIIQRTEERIQQLWDQETGVFDQLFYYDQQNRESLATLLYFLRTFLPLTESVTLTGLGERDFILPPHCCGYASAFNAAEFMSSDLFPQASWNPLFVAKKVVSHNASTAKNVAFCYKNMYSFLPISILSLFLSLGFLFIAIKKQKV
jgi:hypothetical protein